MLLWMILHAKAGKGMAMAEPDGPIKRRSLHDEVVGRIRDMILEGDLAPGIRVPEKLLCARFSISRTPLREALKVLASEGLLELLPNRGAVVARLTTRDVEEMFEVMGALEALSGELACARMEDDDIAEVRALHYQMVLYYRRRNLPDYFRLNQEIHEKIVNAAGNGILRTMYFSLAKRIRRARYMANMSEQRWGQAVEEHERILALLEARDGPGLGAALRQHLRNKCEVVKAAIAGPEHQNSRSATGACLSVGD
jgi:DNA-binding GntR family transcriptional regulator